MAVLAKKREESKIPPFICNLPELANTAAPFQNAPAWKIQPQQHGTNVIRVYGCTTNVVPQPIQWLEQLNDLVIRQSVLDQHSVPANVLRSAYAGYLLDPEINLIIDAKSLYGNASVGMQLLGWPEATATRVSPTPDYMEVEPLLGRVRTTVGSEKLRAQQEAARLIVRTVPSTENAERAIRQLLSDRRSGRLDDAIDVLVLLGRQVVDSVVENALSTFPPSPDNEDYWYALIRASGRIGNRAIVERFLDSQSITLEEGAVQALGDIGDPAATEHLRQVANNSSRPQLIRELARDLAADLA